jgi:hypothetical protein
MFAMLVMCVSCWIGSPAAASVSTKGETMIARVTRPPIPGGLIGPGIQKAERPVLRGRFVGSPLDHVTPKGDAFTPSPRRPTDIHSMDASTEVIKM